MTGTDLKCSLIPSTCSAHVGDLEPCRKHELFQDGPSFSHAEAEAEWTFASQQFSVPALLPCTDEGALQGLGGRSPVR